MQISILSNLYGYLLSFLHFLNLLTFVLLAVRVSKYPEWCVTLTIPATVEADYDNHANAIKWPSAWSNYELEHWNGLLGECSKLLSSNAW